MTGDPALPVEETLTLSMVGDPFPTSGRWFALSTAKYPIKKSDFILKITLFDLVS